MKIANKSLTYTILGVIMVLGTTLKAQDGKEKYLSRVIHGKVVKAIVLDGDTIPVVDLDSVPITEKRKYNTPDERRLYKQLRYNALKVYPYAAEAIRLYNEHKRQTDGLKRKDAKKLSKEKEKKLSNEYEKKLKELTKTQGYILIKMIERELHQPFYDVISDLRGGWQAFKWQMVATWWGFNLKHGYNPKEDETLETILADLKINFKD